ncbi:MAG: hypothetical protein QOC95_1742 [Thermoleophilaceae bacterium]|jgi:hypothetical protein|nr:hypothetical protein [Thermoleophilaceae bacterium]
MTTSSTTPDAGPRLSCIHCGAHVIVQNDLHHPGGTCPVCLSTELVPLADAALFYPLVHTAPQRVMAAAA